MGNLDRRPTRGITGAMGPALVLRSLFAELYRDDEVQGLPVSSGLTTLKICAVSGNLAGEGCPGMDEVFVPENAPLQRCAAHGEMSEKPQPGAANPRIRLIQPTPGLQVAVDPRIPADLQALAFKVSKDLKACRIEWFLNGELVGETGARQNQYLWKLSRGTHLVKARLWRESESDPQETPEISFTVR